MPDLVPQDGIDRHERLRIARDLHDTVAQSLAALGYSIDSLLLDEGIPSQSKRELRSIRLRLSEIVRELREEILAIRTPIESSIEEWLRSKLAIEISWQCTSRNHHLDANHNELAHLLLELLSNAHIHQGLSRASIVEERDCVIVGFDVLNSQPLPDRDAKSERTVPRLGRIGIDERVKLLQVQLKERPEGFELLWQ